MTGLYLGKLRALKSRKGAIEALPKLSKRSPSVDAAQCATANDGFVSFDSAQNTASVNFPTRYRRVSTALEARCPDLVPFDRWKLAVEDARTLLARWGEQAESLGWTARDLFGLHEPPAKPHPSYSRLSRYDETGLVWLLCGRSVVALTVATAAIEGSTGALLLYRKNSKPGLGPVGDSLDEFEPPSGRSAA
jgi:hypothetical protein